MDRLRYLLGILTLVVMIAGGFFLYRQLRTPDLADTFGLQVTFQDARGLKPGADVKFRGIQVGSVRAIDVDEDGAGAVVGITIRAELSKLVRTNSQFWIVTPRFHGLQSGVSGLETLVRDAFLAFANPEGTSEPVTTGSGLRGIEAPVVTKSDVTLPPVARGDLLLRVLLPENHGVTPGARVMFRGMQTGEVRSIALAPTGSHVEVVARVMARYRSTVTDTSVFWVAKPDIDVQMSFSNPVSVNELGSLISPYIAYYAPPQSGVPVHDNYPVAASLSRPSIDVTPVPKAALRKKPEMIPKAGKGPIALVRIVYEALDIDYLSANDTVRRESTGMLYVDKTGRTLILTARSSVDANYFYRESFGERATIENEKIAVQLPGSNVLKATRLWDDPGGLDISVLEVQGLPRNYPITRPDALQYPKADAIPAEGLKLHAAIELGVAAPPVALDIQKVPLDANRGGIVFQSGKAVGLLGQQGEDDEKPRVISLVALPESLRPAK